MRKSMSLTLFAVLSACTPSDKNAAEGTYASDCENAADDDGNGLVDCEDPGCEGAEACADTGDADADSDSDTDSDTDSDSDSDSDADSDTGEACEPGRRQMIQDNPFRTACADRFQMGSPESERGRQVDETQHWVTLSRDFQIGEAPITQEHFLALMGYNPSSFSTCSLCPVDSVTWYEAAAFAKALSEAEGLEPCYDCDGSGEDVVCDYASKYKKPYDCPGYRMPTEAEWEYAARAGTTSAFPNGGNLLKGTEDSCTDPLLLHNGENLGDIAWFCGNNGATTQPVGTRLPNDWGLTDTSGNVWQWLGDGHADYESEEIDPFTSVDRGVRGGYYHTWPWDIRTARRNRGEPGQVDSTIGFRLARTLP